MTMLNNSGVHCPAFLHEIKDITTSCSINKRKSASLNIGATNRSLWSEFKHNVLLNFCNPTGPIFTWKSKKKKKCLLVPRHQLIQARNMFLYVTYFEN